MSSLGRGEGGVGHLERWNSKHYLELNKFHRGGPGSRGRPLSHVAIVSRELGVPAVVGTREATRMLKDGDVVLVDG
ncbi:hypothetical protein KKB83_03945, partial [Patescibacteria group bacterium]|nr:hypothetical protein [Patescibacteria group bacterium]